MYLCLKYLWVAVIKHHNTGCLGKKVFILAAGSRGLGFLRAEKRHGGLSRKQRAYIFKP